MFDVGDLWETILYITMIIIWCILIYCLILQPFVLLLLLHNIFLYRILTGKFSEHREIGHKEKKITSKEPKWKYTWISMETKACHFDYRITEVWYFNLVLLQKLSNTESFQLKTYWRYFEYTQLQKINAPLK